VTVGRPTPVVAAHAFAVSLLAIAVHASAQAVPAQLELSPAVRGALQSAALSDPERAALRLRHGTYDDGDLVSADNRARAALARWDLRSAALADPVAAAELRAEAAVRAGEPEAALAALAEPVSARGWLVRAMALDALRQSNRPVPAPRASGARSLASS
jgi:hypothetical protein